MSMLYEVVRINGFHCFGRVMNDLMNFIHVDFSGCSG